MGYHTRETNTVPCGYHELNPEMEALLAEYLEDGKRKGLQESSIHLHDKIGHYFLSALADTGCAAPQAMNAQNVGAVCLMVSSKWYLSHIRTFLRYAYQARHTDRDYSGIVPLFKRPQPYPSVYTIEEILKIENSVDRDSPHGKRDYAVLLLATRLGIRSGDISSMTFRELDFGRNLILLTQHKTGVDIELPMVPDVKAALKQYLEEERSCYDSPYVFLRIVPPYSHISVQAITKIVRTAIMAAGIDPAGRKQGAHAFRSSLASSMVNDNIPYEAVRKALGHTDQNAIQSYASLDVEQLRNYALPVMEATGTFAAFLEGEVEPVMTQFQSVFKHELAEYLEISQGTVSDDTLRSTRRTLFSFDSLLVAENADRVTETAINHWIRELQQINAPKTVSDKVSYLRKFLRYLQYKGYSVFMPACPKTSDSYVPYIFSDREIQTLLSCADSWANRHTDPKTRRTDMEFCMLLRMLLGCGFRLGEPLAARVKDINFRNGTILIRHAKNNKQRVVPMDRTLTEMLERYCIAMGIKTEPESCLFPAARGQEFSVSKGTFDFRFRNLLRETGLYVQEKSHSRGQCLHCFRHYFAIHSFAQAEKNGRPTDDSVPFLSVYLGHHDMDETEKYLKFSGDMFPEYTELFEDYAAGVFTEVAYEEK